MQCVKVVDQTSFSTIYVLSRVLLFCTFFLGVRELICPRYVFRLGHNFLIFVVHCYYFFEPMNGTLYLSFFSRADVDLKNIMKSAYYSLQLQISW